MYLGVLCVSSVKFTIRVGSCVHYIPCDVLNKFYFFIFTKKIVNGLILELRLHVINQSWHNEVHIEVSNINIMRLFLKGANVIR